MISQVTLGFGSLHAELLKAQAKGKRCLSIDWHWSKGKATVTYWVKEQGELFGVDSISPPCDTPASVHSRT